MFASRLSSDKRLCHRDTEGRTLTEMVFTDGGQRHFSRESLQPDESTQEKFAESIQRRAHIEMLPRVHAQTDRRYFHIYSSKRKGNKAEGVRGVATHK